MTMRKEYNKNGYIKRNVWEPSSLHMAMKHDDMFLGLRKLLEEDEEKYISYLRNVMSKIVNFQKLFLEDIIIHDILKNIGIAAPFMTSPVVFHVISPELHITNGYNETSAHQDWPSTQGSLDCVTVWIPMTDAQIGNFPLEVIPGSHKRGFIDGRMNGSVLEVPVDEKEFIPIECKMGDVIFMSGFTIHRTGKGTGFRVAISQRFDNASEPTFIERGYPCAQKRTVNREVKWKPTVDQVRSVYVD